MPSEPLLVGGDIEAEAIVFQSPFANHHFYVVVSTKAKDRNWLVKLVKEAQYKKEFKGAAAHLNLNGCEGKFFMVYVEDRYDPPICIVRADSETEAEKWFVDELAWSHLEEADLKDHLKPEDEREGENDYSESVGWNSNGQPYLQENICVREIKLHSIRCM